MKKLYFIIWFLCLDEKGNSTKRVTAIFEDDSSVSKYLKNKSAQDYEVEEFWQYY